MQYTEIAITKNPPQKAGENQNWKQPELHNKNVNMSLKGALDKSVC